MLKSYTYFLKKDYNHLIHSSYLRIFMSKNIMPAGRYFVGDLCYVISSQWDDFCSKSLSRNKDPNNHIITLNTGVSVAFLHTMHGDGVYSDQFNNSYPVDAGLIGCIKIDDLIDPEADTSLGAIVEFDEAFECFSDNGVLHFGHISIDTDEDEDEDEDEEEDDDDDDEE